VHIPSTNVIESAFATIHRSDRAKGCVSRDSMLSMIFKLSTSAQLSWRRLRGFEFLAKVIAGVKFRDGIEQPSSEAKAAPRKRERVPFHADPLRSETTRRSYSIPCSRSPVHGRGFIYMGNASEAGGLHVAAARSWQRKWMLHSLVAVRRCDRGGHQRTAAVAIEKCAASQAEELSE
jgi:hypothetical protein